MFISISKINKCQNFANSIQIVNNEDVFCLNSLKFHINCVAIENCSVNYCIFLMWILFYIFVIYYLLLLNHIEYAFISVLQKCSVNLKKNQIKKKRACRLNIVNEFSFDLLFVS